MLSRPLSAALLGFWHVRAAEYAADILGRADTRLSAAWDSDPHLAREGSTALADAHHPLLRRPGHPATRHALESLGVDVAVLSATSAGPAGIFSANALDAETKRVMASVAATTNLLVDSTKLGARAPIRVEAMSLADVIVTDGLARPDVLDDLRAAGVTVVVAAQAGALT